MSMRWSDEELTEKLKNPDLRIDELTKPVTKRQVDLLMSKSRIQLVGTPSAKPHKYHAQRTEYNGILYTSKKEANFAKNLDLLKQARDIDFWLAQVPLALPGGVTYRIDFVTFKRADTLSFNFYVHWIEVKGRDLPMGKLKRKQAEAIFGINIEVV